MWYDEFNGAAVDTGKWEFTIGGGGFGNNEQQYYTDSTDNAFIRDGSLVLKAIQGEYGGEWPICGEIDIMEYMGSDTDTVLGTLHYGNPWVYNTGYYDLENGGSFASGYHDFAMEWLPGEIRWYVDGELYQIQQNWYSTDATGTYAYPAPFDQEFYLMLNLAVGGYFPGDPVPTEQEGQAPNVNLLANPGFDTDLSGWETWTENGSVFSCSEGCLRADIYTTLPNTWSSQLYQNVNITEPGTYRLSFSAKASMPRQICVAVEKDGMSPPLNHTFDISGEWAEYSVEFTVATHIDQAKLVFMLGCVGTTQNVPHTVSLDDISLCRIN